MATHEDNIVGETQQVQKNSVHVDTLEIPRQSLNEKVNSFGDIVSLLIFILCVVKFSFIWTRKVVFSYMYFESFVYRESTIAWPSRKPMSQWNQRPFGNPRRSSVCYIQLGCKGRKRECVEACPNVNLTCTSGSCLELPGTPCWITNEALATESRRDNR